MFGWKSVAEMFLICLSLGGVMGEIYSNSYLEQNFPQDVIEDASLDTEQLLIKYKYPAETHFVTTEDGYILRLHRIANPKKKPVLLLHGLLDSSATWVVMGPSQGLGYFLFDNGYDVWMGNARGNRYSRNHTSIHPMDSEFWTFSWHEIGIYDVPAMINFILKKTSFASLSYVGHSQGTTSFFVFGSMLPQHLKKVDAMYALAPVAFMKNLRNPLLGLIKNFVKFSGDLITEFLPHSKLFLRNCFANRITLKACKKTLFVIMGRNDKKVNETNMPLIFGHTPAGSNLKQVRHYLQLVEQDRFGQYDYGEENNRKMYGQLTPPHYNVSKIPTPMAFFYGYEDSLTSPQDVKRLAAMLQDVKLFPMKQANHITMIWGSNANQEVYQHIKKSLQMMPTPAYGTPTTLELLKGMLLDFSGAIIKGLAWF